MIDLPGFAPQRLACKVKPAAERSIRAGHPWVFDGSIVKEPAGGRAGDLAIIFDRNKNKFLAAGLYDPHSPIRIKILQANTPTQIDAEWFRAKIAGAFAQRQPLLATDTDSYRLLFGENDGLPGLIADVYAQVLVVKVYTTAWLPYLATVLPELWRVSETKTLVLRLSRQVQQQTEELAGLHDGQFLHGELTDPDVEFREHGLRFHANVIRGHKTGFFLDHRHNRKRVGELAAGKRVLDVFSYTGGFTVHALAGGATSVTSLDISAQAQAAARRNVELNGFSEDRHEALVADAFAGLEDLYRAGERFGLVVVDPPAFAKRADERDRALQSYARLAKAAVRLAAPGGILLLASCSSRITADEFFAAVEAELQRSGRNVVPLERTFHDLDHPIGFPEGAYLKSGYYEIG
jgi:23S rRNA (cytosine1962-C5)-methyltransferase